MGEGQIRQTSVQQVFSHFIIGPANGSTGNVAAGHYQRVGHAVVQSVRIIEEKVVQRSVGKHNPYPGIARGHLTGYGGIGSLIKKQYGLLRACQQLPGGRGGGSALR